jgi:hypothetical protein
MDPVSLTSLWQPILVSAVLVFLASFVTHMVLTYHHSDFGKVPSEDEVMDALRRFNLPQGDYMVPRPDSIKAMATKEFQEKLARGPVFIATVFPNGARGMGVQLAQWFVFCLVVSVFAAYMASRSLGPGAEYLQVSQIASTTAFLGYAMARWSDVIWYRRSASAAIKATFDGLVYGLLTGGAFGWLWPN